MAILIRWYCFCSVITVCITSSAQSSETKILAGHIQAQAENLPDSLRRSRVFKDMAVKKRPYIIFPAVMMLAYRTVLSEQVSADCLFDLSCSGFSVKAIAKQGLLRGLWLTTDRLMRCNNRGHDETGIIWLNTSTGKLTDEPEMYR